MYEAILVPLAAFMVYFTAVVIKWAYKSRERLGFSLVLFVLSMMASMLGSAVIYFSSPTLQSIEIAAGLSFTTMTVGLVAVLYALITSTGSKASAPVTQLLLSRRGAFAASVIILVLLNEVLMGWSFSLISGLDASSFAHATSGLQILSLSVNSYWFTLTMASEMLITLYYFGKKMLRELRVILFSQAVIMFLAPPALTTFRLADFAVYAGSAVMIFLYIYFFDFLYKNRDARIASSNYILRLLTLYAFMMAALFYWGTGGTPFFFGLTLLAEMVLFFEAIFNFPVYNESKGRTWQKHPYWTVSLLLVLFVSEYFMAGVIDLVFYGRGFISSSVIAALPSSIPGAVTASLFDFVQYVALITDSAWFYIMMGIEMGALILFQIGRVKQLETKVRLALVIVAYAVYTVFFPYFFYSGSQLPLVPFLGWNMGVGTSGGFLPVFLLAIGGTYLVSGALAFMFGGRQVCSLFCSASLMYQGTFYDSTKSFNKSSSFARKTHGNRLGKVFGITASIVWASIFAAIGISYLDSIGVINLSIFGVDPIVFAYRFYFDFLWYVIFISIPFVGNYGCVTTGMCHWGMFNQLIGRIGFFRLRVKDRYECVTCKTKDCAAACPVGLSALPGGFIKDGEFRNYKCIGVGQCASACPVDNIFFYDVRSWLREKFGRGEPRKSSYIPLSAVTRGKVK